MKRSVKRSAKRSEAVSAWSDAKIWFYATWELLIAGFLVAMAVVVNVEAEDGWSILLSVSILGAAVMMYGIGYRAASKRGYAAAIRAAEVGYWERVEAERSAEQEKPL